MLQINYSACWRQKTTVRKISFQEDIHTISYNIPLLHFKGMNDAIPKQT